MTIFCNWLNLPIYLKVSLGISNFNRVTLLLDWKWANIWDKEYRLAFQSQMDFRWHYKRASKARLLCIEVIYMYYAYGWRKFLEGRILLIIIAADGPPMAHQREAKHCGSGSTSQASVLWWCETSIKWHTIQGFRAC